MQFQQTKSVESASRQGLNLVQRFLAPAIAAMTLVVLLATGIIEPFNAAMTDMRFRLLERAPSDTLVVVEIDPKSLSEEERWPWPRDRYGAAVGKLQDAGAALIAFDVDFSSLSDQAGDDAFAQALARRPGEVVLPVFWQWSSRSATDGVMIKTPPNPKFLNDAIIASVTLTAERNGVVRRGWRGVTDGDAYRASIASVLAGAPPADAGTFLIDYAINPADIRRLSFHDVLAGNFSEDAVRGKNILIGATALELGDEFAAPVYGIMPGVMFHALSYESMVGGRMLTRPHGAIPAILALALIFALTAPARNWGRWKIAAVHVALLTVLVVAPTLLQAFAPISFDVGEIIIAQVLSLACLVGARLQLYARQFLQQRAATAHFQALTALVVRDNSDGVIVTDKSGRIELCNEQSRALLGAEGKVLVGSLIQDIAPNFPMFESRPENEAAEARVTAPRQSQRSEFTSPGDANLVLEIVASCSAQASDDTVDAPDAVVYTLRDISARKRIEEAERQAKEAAIAASNAKTQLISNMSHELRTPLNGVIGFADILQKEAYGPLGVAEYKDYAASIYASGRRLLSVFNDMLHIAKLDAGEFELSKSEVAVDELLETCAYKFEEQAEEEGKKLKIETPKGVDMIEIDVSVFKEIFNHLISNALKYTKEHATITVRAEVTQSDIVFQVEDNGCGVDPACLPRLGDVFYQADAALNRKFEGVGLGLYVVTKFVELHGGSVSFASEPDVGFLAELRFARAEIGAQTSAAA